MAIQNRVKAKYDEQVRPVLMKEFNYSSSMQIPRLEKIVINIGVGEATGNSKLLDDAKWKEKTLEDLSDDLFDLVLGSYSKEYVCKDILEINDVIIANKGEKIIISDATPLECETLEDVDGYCDIENTTTITRFNATYLDIDYSILKENIKE